MRRFLFFSSFLFLFFSYVSAWAQYQSITGYDGIQFGMTIKEAKHQLAKVKGVSRDDKGKPFWEKVPLKPYYRYWVTRSNNEGSEVSLWFEKGRLVQIRDVFGGKNVSNQKLALSTFNQKTKLLTQKWGGPTKKQKNLIIWAKGKHAAVLRLIPPDHPLAYTVLKLVISAKGENTKEFQKTICGKIF